MSAGANTLRCALAALGLAAAWACAQPAPVDDDRQDRPDFVPADAGTGDGGTGFPEPDASLPPPAPGTVRVATFNTHLFFDATCQSGRCGSGDFEQQPGEQEFARRADELARAIRNLNATVVLLQEVETQECLDALLSRLGGAFPVATLGEVGYAGSVDVAVLGQGELVEVRKHRSKPLQRPDGTTTWFTREFLEVRLKVGEATLIAFGAHFRSKNDDDPGRRLAEATAAQEIVRAAAAEVPGALVVFGGDLNDVPGSEPLLALESSGELLRVASELSDAEAATYWWGGQGRPLDHLYQGMKASGAYLKGTAHPVRGDCPKCGYGGSDHAALVADFQLP